MIGAISNIASVGASELPTRVGSAAAAGAADFSSVLAEVAAGAVETMKAGEATAIGGINGTRSVQDVVDSLLTAEQALQTAIAVRDKLVVAYQEISRMAI